ncbi:YTH domain-containing protein ECT4-like isoform X6 [Triticum dicoccoides]|uniref:YTH domain-containing protein ECT4-like isoform X6 n=1 Tax=Triticum dicoccoides TaxID=85692 RepID=UPI000E788085|nr:YTH domain-containing protein ECT4-like isoform X6 [Triticum dicoccoides]
MAVVAPTPAPPAAPAPAAAAAAPAPALAPAPAADQATDLLQKMSLESQPKAAADGTELAGATKGPVASQPLSVSIPQDRSITPVVQDFTDPNMFYLPAYYYGGYDGTMSEWDEYTRYVNQDGVEVTPAVYGDIYGYGYAPYGAYSPASSPVPTVDGQMFAAQHYQYPAYYQPPTPIPSTTQGDQQPSANADNKPAAKADAAKTTTNGVPNVSAQSNSATAPLGSSYQNSSLTPDGTYRAPLLGGVPSTGYVDSTYGYDTTGAHYAWYDGSAYTNAQQRPTTANYTPSSAYNSNGSSARYQTKSPTPQQTGNRRPTTTTGSATPTYPNRMYSSTQSYNQYGNSVKTGLMYGNTGYGSTGYGSTGYGSSGYGSNGYGSSGYGSSGYGSSGYDSRLYGRWGVSMDTRYNRPRGRGNGYYGFGNESQDGTIELNRGPRSGRFKNQKAFGHTVTIAVKGQTLPSSENKDASDIPDKAQFNLEDFPVQYDDAKFFVIKSYSEDDIHKSIKYNVWASTTNGNKKLDAAYQEAQAKGSSCPIFLFFSVNTSGQFVGVAEMTGPVDFEKTLEFWQQDKWNGSFSVKWHIVKDVPNNILKHIVLENNEGKPVTNSRDTQDINLEQGIQMLKIFKEHVSKTSILEDFAFYENRQKLMQEKRIKQQQIQKQVWDSRAPNPVAGEKQQELANGKPKVSLPNGVNGEKQQDAVNGKPKSPVANGVNGDAKVPAEKAAAAAPPAVTYAAKVAQTAAAEKKPVATEKKPVVANGAVKTGVAA